MGVTVSPSSTLSVTITGLDATFEMTAAEDIVTKEAVCQSQTEAGKCYKADANDSTKMPVVGIAKESATTGNTLDVYYSGKVTDVVRDADFNIGDTIYMSNTPGQVTKTPPAIGGTGQQRLGIATGSDDILLALDLTVMELL